MVYFDDGLSIDWVGVASHLIDLLVFLVIIFEVRVISDLFSHVKCASCPILLQEELSEEDGLVNLGDDLIIFVNKRVLGK